MLYTPMYFPPPLAGTSEPLGNGTETPIVLLIFKKFAAVGSSCEVFRQFNVPPAAWQFGLAFLPFA